MNSDITYCLYTIENDLEDIISDYSISKKKVFVEFNKNFKNHTEVCLNTYINKVKIELNTYKINDKEKDNNIIKLDNLNYICKQEFQEQLEKELIHIFDITKKELIRKYNSKIKEIDKIQLTIKS